MQIHDLLTQYRTGRQTPEETVEAAYDRIHSADTNAWITLRPKAAVMDDVDSLGAQAEHPLYGVPFAVKDNIDFAGVPTTAGCPGYSYDPSTSATVVSKLVDAGALLIGKTNMDQFASGLVGTRSPYGACRNVHNGDYISGGSSSGSAVAVARNHVAFALGTDTAGSGRVPAALNGLVGLKPSRGALSTAGVVPACRSLDCISVFTHSCKEAALVTEVASGYDPDDPYSRPDRTLGRSGDGRRSPELGSLTVGKPDADGLEFFGDAEAKALFSAAVDAVGSRFGVVSPVDFELFDETASLLYDGPWVAERLSAIREFVHENGEEVHPVVREILSRGEHYSAVETFEALHELARLKRRCERLFGDDGIDVMVTPTVGTAYTRAEIHDRPIERNSRLGYYTDYVNLLDLSAISVPAGQFADGPQFGLTVLGEAGEDRRIVAVGREIRAALDR